MNVRPNVLRKDLQLTRTPHTCPTAESGCVGTGAQAWLTAHVNDIGVSQCFVSALHASLRSARAMRILRQTAASDDACSSTRISSMSSLLLQCHWHSHAMLACHPPRSTACPRQRQTTLSVLQPSAPSWRWSHHDRLMCCVLGGGSHSSGSHSHALTSTTYSAAQSPKLP